MCRVGFCAPAGRHVARWEMELSLSYQLRGFDYDAVRNLRGVDLARIRTVGGEAFQFRSAPLFRTAGPNSKGLTS